MTQVYEIGDDDGVFVIATTKHLSQFANRDFDYDFPDELENGMAAQECIAVVVGDEGCYDVSFNSDLSAAKKVLGPFGITLTDGDALYIMPYSEYTMLCDHGNGDVSAQPPEHSHALPAGHHSVQIGQVVTTEYDEDEGEDVEKMTFVVHTTVSQQTPPSGLAKFDEDYV